MTSPTPQHPPATPLRPARPRRSRWRMYLLSAVILLALFLLFTYLLLRSTPGWYRPLDPAANATLDAADLAQRKIVFDLHNDLQRVPLGSQTWSITQDDVNALLAVRFTPVAPAADGSATPTGISTGRLGVLSSPFVRFTRDHVTLAVRSSRIPGPSPAGGLASVSFVVQTSTDSDGTPMGSIRLDSASLGCLPIPKSIIAQKLHDSLPSLAPVIKETLTYQLGVRDSASLMPQIQSALTAIANGDPFPLRFTYEHRQVELQQIDIEDGALTLTIGPPPLQLLLPSHPNHH